MDFKYRIGSRSFGDDKYNIFLSIGDTFGRSPIVYAEEITEHYPDHVIFDLPEFMGVPMNWAYRYHRPSVTNSLRTTLSSAFKRYILAPTNSIIIKDFQSNPAIKICTIMTYDDDRSILIIGDKCAPEWSFNPNPFIEYRAFPVYHGTLNDCVAVSNNLFKVQDFCTEHWEAIFTNADYTPIP